MDIERTLKIKESQYLRNSQGTTIYGSAKPELPVFLQGFWNRLLKSGVTVTIIKPGFVYTAMTLGLPDLSWWQVPKPWLKKAIIWRLKEKNQPMLSGFGGT